jgi:hypothetical protein
MKELALHMLDIAENSIAAGARNIELIVEEDLANDRLRLCVADDGCGMDAEMVSMVANPFITTRTTRKVGLGIPLLKAAAEACQGGLEIASTPGVGTKIWAEFQHSHIDRMPLGDLASTMLTLCISYPQAHWVLRYAVDRREFVFDDQPIKETLQGVPLTEPDVLAFLRTLLEDGISGVRTFAPARP